MSDFDELYQEIILDHYRSPRGAAVLDNVPDSAILENPTCGDSIKVEVSLSPDGSFEGVRFEAKGCAISTASASMMTIAVAGRGLEEVREIAWSFIRALRGEDEPRLARRDGRSRRLQGRRQIPRPRQMRHPRLARSAGGAPSFIVRPGNGNLA